MRSLILLLNCLLLSACVSPVVIDQQGDVSPSRYQTYAFIEQDEDTPRALDDQRARKALETALAEKGLTPAAAEQADIQVRHFFKREQRYDGSVMQFGFGYGFNNVAVGATTPVEGEMTEEFKLVVQLVDPASNNVVWQATSRDRLHDEMSSERRQAHIDKAVKDMFERFQ
ncbi:DUF4136 domain-containing protein [Alcanivorax sp. S6407]|uniref:DUF4136 domain-containing protein n=1 Tax=Alcanivorax sp. S6407 TaxID=2926424 RepID=UPI001FF25E80|nr:DUF4136 domain-containing protein [Alcanivorax sp. S6407]MCK0154426.1 DUF4136 domain-containing protein [Alcanivorax sp. S6407]